jgi:hypothetical protein
VANILAMPFCTKWLKENYSGGNVLVFLELILVPVLIRGPIIATLVSGSSY